MFETNQAAGGGPLSISDAANLLASTPAANTVSQPKKKEDVQPAQNAGDETESEAEPIAAEDASEPSEAIAGDEADDAEPAAEELPAIDAPHSWDAEAKAKFAELPREAQEIIAARETERDKAISKAQQESAEERKKISAELAKLGTLTNTLDAHIPRWEQAFQDRWTGVDWTRVIDEVGAEQALKLKMQYETERDQLQRMHFVQQATRNAQHIEFVKGEFGKLAKLAPDLADEKKGAQLRPKVVQFLIENGAVSEQFGPVADQIRWLSAPQAAIAYDAMRYREAKATALKSNPVTAKSKQPAIAPGAKQAATPQKQKLADLNSRLNRTGKIDDAVALLKARSK